MSTTATETNADLALRYLELVLAGDTGPAVEEIIHPDFVHHHFDLRGPDGFRELVRRVNTTFSDIANVPQDVIASGDRVVARTRMTARHTGDWAGAAPTGAQVEVDQIHIWRVADGRIADHWICMQPAAGGR